MLPKERGIVHIAQVLLLFALVGAIAIGIYFMSRPKITRSKATCPNESRVIIFEGSPTTPPTCQEATTVTSRNVKLWVFYATPDTAVSAPVSTNMTVVYPTHFRVSNNLNEWEESKSYDLAGTTVDWQLTPENGTKAVHVEFRVNGVWTSRVSSTVEFRRAPSQPITPPPPSSYVSPSPTPEPSSELVTYELLPGDNFIGLPLELTVVGGAYPPASFLEKTNGTCTAVWKSHHGSRAQGEYLTHPVNATITDYFTNKPIPTDTRRLGLGNMIAGAGYFIKCSAPVEITVARIPGTITPSLDTIIRQNVRLSENPDYLAYISAPYKNQSSGGTRVKARDVLNRASELLNADCNELFYQRIACTGGSGACSIAGVSSFKKNAEVGNFTLHDTSGYALKCQKVAEASPAPTPGPVPGVIQKTITISFNMAGRREGKHAEPFSISMEAPQGSGARIPYVATSDAVTNDQGTYTWTTELSPSIPYKVTLRAQHSVPITISQVIFDANRTATLDFGRIPNGNANTDPVINILDFSLLARSFGKSSGQGGFNPGADFNGDGVVTILDFSILAGNFGKGPITR